MTDLVDNLLAARYFRAGETSFDDVCTRVAFAIGNNDREISDYYNAMINLEFLPNSPTLMNAGTDLGQLSACFTLPVEDSLTGIFDAVKWGALIHQSGGGTGYNFSKLRPEGSPVKSTDGVASGAVSFMHVFNAATDVIKQGGRRRGANMGILDVTHPEIMKFLKAKSVEGDLSNFNISVMVDDEFMNCVKNKKSYIDGGNIWNAIIDGIYNNGEPGILFYDTINKYNPTPNLGNLEITNPCGEQPLLPFESCVLGSINISKFVDMGKKNINSIRLEKTVRMAVRFLDSVIDKNVYPLPQIEEATKKTRKIGLGLMGVHDALIMMGIPYDSEKARELCDCIMKNISNIAVNESETIAEEKCVFPDYIGSTWNKRGLKVRNAALTTIAPTGSISLLAGCSSGIEPNFSYVYTRKNTVGKEFGMVHPLFMKELVELCPMPEDKLYVIHEMKTKGSIQHIKWLPDEFKALFKTALDIDWKDHVLMQAAFQKHTHNAISKTINMPESATKEDIAKAILLAWKEGCKGLTIYRTNSRKDVVLALEDKKDEKQSKTKTVQDNFNEKCSKEQFTRPREMNGKTYLAQSGCCRLYVTVNMDDKGKPMEVFIRTVGAGCEANSNALGRSISLGLQAGIPYTEYVKSLGKVKCVSAIKNKNSEGVSCADVVGKCIEMAATKQSISTLDDWDIKKVNNKNSNFKTVPNEKVVGSILNSITQTHYKPDPNVIITAHNSAVNKCPECGAVLDFGEGCNMGICKTCGWSGCS